MGKFDVLIIGGGPIGLACGIAATKAGLSHIIIEKGALVNSLYNYPMYMHFFSTSERLEIGGVPFMSMNPKPGRQEALEYYFRVAQKFKLNIHLFEEVKEVKNNSSNVEQVFEIVTTKDTYTTKHI